MSASEMERFWDARAREDALWFVDSRLRYGAPDEEAFWAGGEEALGRLLGGLGVTLASHQVVVDIGCGVGRLTRPVAGQVARVLAIDVSSEMIERARQLNPRLDNVEWVVGDGVSLRPVADGSVDVCLSHVVFRHIPDPTITLGYVRDMGRVLRPGGFAAFEFSNDPRAHQRRARPYAERLAALIGRAPHGIVDAEWVGSHVEMGDLQSAASEVGMKLEASTGEGSEFCGVLLRRTGLDPGR